MAVQVRDPAVGINKLITKRAANDAPVVIADTRSIAAFERYVTTG